MPKFLLQFDSQGGSQTDGYKLIELPKELVDIAEGLIDQSLAIRGGADEDAVLCTKDRTYSIRSVTLSNCYCVLTPSRENEKGDAVIRGNIQQVLELSASVAKLHKLSSLLRGREYDGLTEDEELNSHNSDSFKLETIRSMVQASDREFAEGLQERRILLLNGELRPITLSYLSSVLEMILNVMVALSLSPEATPVVDVTDVLERDHEIPRTVISQVMSWFGNITESESSPSEKIWCADIESVVRQLGLGLLSDHRNDAINEEIFMDKWKKAVGDAYEPRAQLLLLSGNYICRTSSEGRALVYFPSSELPINPADRFTDLFLTQSKWKADEIAHFLKEIAVDNKERDKLLMKYARTTTDNEGLLWYTSRNSAT